MSFLRACSQQCASSGDLQLFVAASQRFGLNRSSGFFISFRLGMLCPPAAQDQRGSSQELDSHLDRVYFFAMVKPVFRALSLQTCKTSSYWLAALGGVAAVLALPCRLI